MFSKIAATFIGTFWLVLGVAASPIANCNGQTGPNPRSFEE